MCNFRQLKWACGVAASLMSVAVFSDVQNRWPLFPGSFYCTGGDLNPTRFSSCHVPGAVGG